MAASSIQWIFEPDGSLRDIYVQDVTLLDWEKLIDFFNLNYELKFGENDINQIDKEYDRENKACGSRVSKGDFTPCSSQNRT